MRTGQRPADASLVLGVDLEDAFLDQALTQYKQTRPGVMQEMQHPAYATPLRMPAWPVRINGRMPKVEPSPMLGQHTADVLGEWLGMNASEIEGLKGENVVG